MPIIEYLVRVQGKLHCAGVAFYLMNLENKI